MSFNRRMDAWLADLAEAVSGLEDQLEDLATDEVFIDAVVNASREAQATHQQENLEALRNGVLNSIAPDAPNIDEQARFFRLVGELSVAHLRLLRFLKNPGEEFDRAGQPRPKYSMVSMSQLLEEAIPTFDGQREWYDLLMSDLANAQLVRGDRNTLHTTTTGGVLTSQLTTGLGGRFLAFISAAGQ
jgi:hypothetical protein